MAINIPDSGRVVDIRSRATPPSVQTIPVGAESAIGAAISSFGTTIQRLEIKRQQQIRDDEKLYRRRALLDTKKRMLDNENAVLTATGEDAIQAYDSWRESTSDLPDYTGARPVDSMGYIGKKVSARGISELTKQQMGLDREEYLINVNSRLTRHVANERRIMELNMGEETVAQEIQDLVSGKTNLDDAKERVESTYEEMRSVGKEAKREIVDKKIQNMTVALLDAANDSKDVNVAQDVLDGDYNDELKDTALINKYRDQFTKVLSEVRIAGVVAEHSVAKGFETEKEIVDSIRGNKSLSKDEQDSAIKDAVNNFNIIRRDEEAKEKELHDTTEQDFALRLNDPVNPTTSAQVRDAANEDIISGDELITWESRISSQAKGRDLSEENDSTVEKRYLIEAEAFTPNTPPAVIEDFNNRINSSFALGKDDKGISRKALNGIQTERDKNIKEFTSQSLKDELESINKLSGKTGFDFVPLFKGTEIQREDAHNDAVNNVKREIKECFNKTGDASACKTKALKPIIEARAKAVMDKATTFFGATFFLSEEEEQAQKVLEEAEKRRGGNLREDGTQKGTGFLGVLKRPDGKVSTEISISVEFDGKEHLIPSLVPTLTQGEIDFLLEGNKPSDAIVKKAVTHARKRIKAGKSPFKESKSRFTIKEIR